MQKLTELDIDSLVTWAHMSRMQEMAGEGARRVFAPLLDTAIRNMDIGKLSELGQATFMLAVGVEEDFEHAQELLGVLDHYIKTGVFAGEIEGLEEDLKALGDRLTSLLNDMAAEEAAE
jgi:hypothetical protein